MSSTELQPAFILHSRPYGNTSLIIDCLTSNQGRLSAMARSARGLRSRYRGMLQLFSPLFLSWRGQRELKNLCHAERNGPIYLLTGQALVCGFYLNELLQRLLVRDDPQPAIYHYYQTTLAQLQHGNDPRWPLRCFEKKLLDALGYGLPLAKEAQSQHPIIDDAHYQYLPERGFLRCNSNSDHPLVFSGKTLLCLSQHIQCNDEPTLRQAQRLLQLALKPHLGPKPIVSRELLK